ncbi:MAG: PAS domain-containing protein [Candidatus Sulfotelmatobacter sp.]
MSLLRSQTRDGLRDELEQVRARPAESEATLRAVRTGGVDAILVNGPRGNQIFTLESPEEPYRILAEGMSEGAATLTVEGTILFCNRRLSLMAKLPPEQLLGSSFLTLLNQSARPSLFGTVASRSDQQRATGEPAATPRRNGRSHPAVPQLDSFQGTRAGDLSSCH